MQRLITFLSYIVLPWVVMAQEPADTVATDSLPPMPWEQAVSLRMDSLMQSDLFRTTQVGLMVYDLTADTVLYAYNHQQRMRPASTMKVLTAVTALDVLGGAHRFTTELRTGGPVEGRTLRGDLICVGTMDPSFESGDLKLFVDRVRMAGIDTIRGRIVADRSWKDDLLLGEGWCWDDDNPTLSPLLVNRKDDFTQRLERELTNVGVVIVPQSAVATADTIAGRPSQQPSAPNRQRAGDAASRTGRGEVIASCSHTLDQLLTRMMKQSDNLYAEAVFYHIGAAAGLPATAKNARSAVKRLISKLGFDAANYNVADGSGLSLYNYVSAELLVAFLRYAHQHSRIAGSLRPSLPTAGADGTLQSRMKNTPAQYNVRAKTGTLTGISSLAGYLFAPNGHDVCFAIINQGVVSTRQGRAFQDRVCQALCQPSSPAGKPSK